jgi:hypothetical protein
MPSPKTPASAVVGWTVSKKAKPEQLGGVPVVRQEPVTSRPVGSPNKLGFKSAAL